MSVLLYACPGCAAALPPCPVFGADWTCRSCRRIFIALPAADGSPQALDAVTGVFGWSEGGQPVLLQRSVPAWMTVRRAVAAEEATGRMRCAAGDQWFRSASG